MTDIGRLLLIAGLALAAVGGLMMLLGGVLPIGRRPGDLGFEAGGARIYVPLATGLLLSVILTVVLNILLRLFR